MDVTYVSAYYNIYSTQKDDYLDYYIKFLEAGFRSILFLDKTIPEWQEKLSQYKNLTIISEDTFTDVPLINQFPKETTTLPESRNNEKDTYEYLILMNSKIHLLNKAIQYCETDKMAWADFGMHKLLRNPIDAYKRLLQVQINDTQILIPGCVEKNTVDINNVNWRFCGTLFFGKKPAIVEFYKQCSIVLDTFRTNITWEVNVWALAELNKPELFQWYKGDHNDSLVSFPIQGSRKIIVTIMIKNEERIIKRCIMNALNIADAICISDTGSTDGTIDLLKEFLPSLNIPATFLQHEWQDFGHNRTLSFRSAQEYCKTLGWNPELTYSLLLDADMNFVMTPSFTKDDLNANGYRIKQQGPSIEYYNTRLIKIGYPWSCVGVTHEYWDGSNCNPLESIYINDIGDGGCKSDKFTRDERLLKKGLEDDPTNCRYMFYLAQTLKDLKKLPESIEMYKRRTTAGGWFEEIWYSMYIISKLYHELGNLTEMEYWALKAYDINKNRSENIYFLTRIFRERSQHHKAWHYLQIGINITKPNEVLFLESDVYDHLFEYEKTILNYYIQPHKKNESLLDLIQYYNKRRDGHSYSNLQFYVQQAPIRTLRSLPFPPKGDYVATSTSIYHQEDDTYRLNVRYVDYRIQNDGSYLMMKDGILSRDNPVKTRNFTIVMDSEFQPLTELEEMTPAFPSLRDVHIQGLEDLRIYKDNKKKLKWLGTSMEYSYNGKIGQVRGTYNTTLNLLEDAEPLIPHKPSECEKNWIPIGDDIIYCWKPLTIGKIENSKFVPTFSQETPHYFEHVRGSSNVVEYNNSLWTLTHSVMYLTPRKYYHQLMRLNKDSKRLEVYSLPFFFKTNHIEYCLGMEIRNETLCAIVSQNDSNPILVTIQIADLTFINA